MFKHIPPLNTHDNVSKAMRRVISESMKGKVEVATGKSFIWMLKTLSDQMRDTDLEKRIEALENKS